MNDEGVILLYSSKVLYLWILCSISDVTQFQHFQGYNYFETINRMHTEKKKYGRLMFSKNNNANSKYIKILI